MDSINENLRKNQQKPKFTNPKQYNDGSNQNKHQRTDTKVSELPQKFEAFRGELINALSDELGDDAAEDKLNRHAAVIMGTKKFVERLVIDSITTTMGQTTEQ